MITADNQVVFWSRQAGGLLQSSGFLSIEEIVKLGRLNRSSQITAEDVIAYIELEITNNHGLSSGEQSSEQELKQAIDFIKQIFEGHRSREISAWLRRDQLINAWFEREDFDAWLEQMKVLLSPGRKIPENRSQKLAEMAEEGLRTAVLNKYEIMVSKMLQAIPENERLQAIMQKAEYRYEYPILFYAAEDINVFKAIQNILADDELLQAIKHKYDKNRTILHHMATTNCIEGFKHLLDVFYSDEQQRLQAIMTRDKEGKTALHHAVNAEKADMFAYLLGLFAGTELLRAILEKDRRDQTVLCCTIEAGKVDVVIQRLSSLSAIELLQALMARDKKGRTILHHTVREKDIGVKMLNCLLGLTSSAEILQAIMQKNNEGSTVLHYIAGASIKELSFVLNLLSPTEVLQAINEKDNQGKTVIDHAGFENYWIQRNFQGWYLKTLAQLYTLNPSNECSQAIHILQPLMEKDLFGNRTFVETLFWKDAVPEILGSLLKAFTSAKDRQAAIMLKDSHNCTVFHLAAKHGDIRTLNFCLSLLPEDMHSQVILQKGNDGKTALHHAAEAQAIAATKLATLEYLLNLFPVAMRLQLILQEKYNDGRTILHHAAEAGDIAILEYALNLCPSRDVRQQVLRAKDNEGRTVLHYAAEVRDFEMINFLLNVFDTPAKRLQALQEKCGRGGTVLRYAKVYKDTFQYLQTLESYYCSTSTIERLQAITSKYDYGTWENPWQATTALHYAAEYAIRSGKNEIFKYALNLFAGPELLQAILQKNDNGQSVLHCVNHNIEMLEQLLSLFSGTELFQAITAKSESGITVLSQAVTCGQVEILEYLKLLSDTERLQAIMEKDKQGRTTLHNAVVRGEVEIFKGLLNLLPDTERSHALLEKDEIGRTVLRCCAQAEYYDIFAYLLNLVPSIERLPALMEKDRYYNRNGRTVFHKIVRDSSSKVEIVEQLLNLLSGTERMQVLQEKDRYGETVLDYARKPNNPKLCKFLEKALASAEECSQEAREDSGHNLRLSP